MIFLRHHGEVGIDDIADGAHLLLGREVNPGSGGVLRPDLAILPAELEVDRGQQTLIAQCEDNFRRRRFVPLGRHVERVFLPRLPAKCPPHLAADFGEVRHLPACPVDDEIQRTVEEVIERERHGAFIVGHQCDGAMCAADPGGDFARIGDGRGETDELDVFRAEDDRLFPRRAAFRVGKEVDLIEDDRVDRVHFPRRLDEHIAHDFGRHHEDRRARIDRHIAGQ